VAVWLQSSPGAIVERNSICGGSAATNTGVVITDASAGTVVRGNGILSTGATNIGTGVALGDCMGAWPWIVGNQYIFSAPAISGGQSAGVSAATGNCHPVVEGNGQIVVGGDSSPGAAVGVVCGASSTTPSACVVIGNRFIGASAATVPSAAVTGIACQAGACARLARNVITVSGGGDTVGISIAGGGPLVDRNDVTGGCGASSTIGVFTDDAHARVQNNVIRGAACGNRPSPPQVDAFHAHVAAPQAGAPANEVDVHSNTMDAGGAGSCTGAAASLGLTTGATPPSALGIFRNNILRAGGCQTQRYGFWEDTSGLAARVFENNDLDPTGPAGGPTLYRDNSGAALSLSMVNGRAGAGGNISVDPLFAGAPADFHLGAGSACINTGTATGAPAADFDGKPRDAQPDIGAFEK
jgi:hypothetical protein